jgi:hypothetical protein
MFCSVAARLWLRAVSAADWFGNITAVVSANGYNTANGHNAGSDLSEQFGHNAGSNLSERMCESVAPTAHQRMKSHLHTVWLTRFQKICADFLALRNIS